MTPPNSLDFGHPGPPSSPSTRFVTTPTSNSSPKETPSPSAKSPRNRSNRLWIQEEQRRTFLHHLTKWSLSHDSSPHFHGKISLLTHSSRGSDDIGLSKSVSCILTDTTFTDARKKIVIRLFPPQQANRRQDTNRQRDHDSMDLSGAELNLCERQQDASDTMDSDENGQPPRSNHGITNSYYKLVVRCGAGWMSAREYFSKLYFMHLAARKADPGTLRHIHTLDDTLEQRSKLLGPPASPKDTVTISPLFHPFCRLPPELQEMILRTAAGLGRSYSLCYDAYTVPTHKRRDPNPISLSTMFQISKEMNEHLVPYIYHSIDFHFGLTGFTNFLWQSGPTNRPEIRRLTFHFGKLALLHCIRWLAPDPVFDLLEPPVATSPHSLQYFWRCQIQDLARDLNLFTITIDLRNVPTADIPMMIRILESAFGSVERLLFVETDKQGNSKKVNLDDARLEGLEKKQSWRELCAEYFERHKNEINFFRWELIDLESERFEGLVEPHKEFFDQ